jgi:cell division transport system ATP-binding protein
MIQMFHVWKSYRQETAALKDLNLEIAKGDFIFLSGPSGAGKTTMLKLIFCEETVTSGQLLVDGRNIARLKEFQIPYLRRQIGVVFQDFKLIHSMTVADNVALALEVTGIYGTRARKKVQVMINAVGLGHKLNSYPLQLSAGEQQRVAIARALVNDPKILLADEPTGNLDPDLTMEIMELLKIINARGTTVVVASHNQRLVETSGKRVIRIKDGALVEN